MRLALTLSALFVVSTLTAAAVSFLLLSGELAGRHRADAQQMAENLAATYQVAGLPELHAQIATNVITTRDFSNLYLFIDRSGAAVFGNFSVRQPFTGSRDLVAGRDISLVGAPPGIEGQNFAAYGLQIPAGWILTARNTRWIADTRRIVIQTLAWGLGAALALSVLIALWLGRRSERRIARLNAMLDQVAAGNMALRFDYDPGWPDDISRVADAMNDMLDRLGRSVDSLRQVSTDVAHDLRTPLTRLRARLEPLLVRDDLPEGAAQELDLAVAELDTLVRTFNAVLRISQIESGRARPRLDAVDLRQLCADLHEMLLPVAEDQGHRFRFADGTGDMHVTGDRDMLAQAITNLVENAIRHCPDPAEITLALARTGDAVEVSVADTGPGIEAEARDDVFRRFFRLEKSRSTEGSGLGLALVAAILRLHDATINLSDNGPGLRVTVRFGGAHPPDRAAGRDALAAGTNL
ncbi:two-component sensor histidine kinase [Rhodobacteraceae bacterium KN286]|uniref:histidine kinase n=2 Tax=Oceanomicrobium pacificus TaxID=2692916 RepID=A0A6B0TUI6_9RHOB|nr:two-component sensor histidine kinase [Oceanomicrobium pacificus]